LDNLNLITLVTATSLRNAVELCFHGKDRDFVWALNPRNASNFLEVMKSANKGHSRSFQDFKEINENQCNLEVRFGRLNATPKNQIITVEADDGEPFFLMGLINPEDLQQLIDLVQGIVY
jgi:hypothetical protein